MEFGDGVGGSPEVREDLGMARDTEAEFVAAVSASQKMFWL